MNDSKETSSEKQESLRLTILNRVYELMTAAFSLVAALAWNDAIQTTFTRLFGGANALWAKFLYALLVTVFIVWLGTRLSKTSKALQKLLNKNNP